MLDALKVLSLLVIALAGCTSPPTSEYTTATCGAGENSYNCQVIRYQRASGPP